MRFFNKNQIIGIPDKAVKSLLPEESDSDVWRLVIQRHDANVAGRHFDIRLADPTKPKSPAFSWATRYLPDDKKPRRLAIQQPDHTQRYMDFKGTIPSGYGAGTVTKHYDSQVKILKKTQDKLSFRDLNSGNKYSLIRTDGDKWLMIKTT